MLMNALAKPAAGLAKMREAAAIVVETLEMIGAHVQPGVTTAELDRLCHDFIVARGGIPACVGYQGYEHATCISVNHVVCHGVPGPKALRKADLLNIDLVVQKDGWHADSSAMYSAGKPALAASRLAAVTQECLYRGISAVRPGAPLGAIGQAIEAHARAHGFSVVRDYCGHGIGQAMHETPEVLHYRSGSPGLTLLPGMTFTIEPMLNAGGAACRVLPDRWTVVTKDHSLSAQWEHTVLVTDTGCEILTLRPSEQVPWSRWREAERL